MVDENSFWAGCMLSFRDLEVLPKFAPLLAILLFTAALMMDLGMLDEHFMPSTAWRNQLFGLACPPPNIFSQSHPTWHSEEYRCAHHEVPAPP